MSAHEFLEYISTIENDEYLRTHIERYLQTLATFEDVFMGANTILELGSISPIAGFCRDKLGKDLLTYIKDLRIPFELPSKQFDLILSLEVVEHINDPLQPTSSIGEIAMFQAARHSKYV